MSLDNLTANDQSASQGDSPELESLLSRINSLANGQPVPSTPATIADPAIPQPPASLQQVAAKPPAAQQAHPALQKAKAQPAENEDAQWQPSEPESLEAAGVSDGQLEHLVLRCLSAMGDLSGHQLADQHSMPFRLIEPVLAGLKQAQLVAFRGAAAMNDYVYQLTDQGRETAKKLTELCSYFGSAPVPLSA